MDEKKSTVRDPFYEGDGELLPKPYGALPSLLEARLVSIEHEAQR